MNLHLISTLTPIAAVLRSRLERAGLGPVICVEQATDRFELRLAPTVPSATLELLLCAIAPFQPTLIPGASLADADAELHVGEADSFYTYNLKLYTDSLALSTHLRDELTELGFDPGGRDRYGAPKDNRLRYGAASALARQIVRWLLLEQGIATLTEEKAWSDDDRNLEVQARDPEVAAIPPAERFGVRLCADDLTIAHDLWSQLREAGFRDIEIILLRPEEAREARLQVNAGPFADTPEAAQLQALIQRLADRLGVARDRYPVVNDDRETGQIQAELILPLAACRSGARRPYRAYRGSEGCAGVGGRPTPVVGEGWYPAAVGRNNRNMHARGAYRRDQQYPDIDQRADLIVDL